MWAADTASPLSAVQRQEASSRRQARMAEGAFFALPWPTPLASPGASASAARSTADCPALSGREQEELVADAARREGVLPQLVRAVIEQESAFRPCAVSVKGAQGLMQLMPETAAELGVQDAFEPWQNVAGGTRLLRKLLDRYGGDLRLALAAYNAGPGRVDKSGGVPLIPETQQYVTAILAKVQ